MTRAEKAAEAAQLRAEGLFYREIAERMGISLSYAAELCDDPDGQKVRARKANYQGTCGDCGLPTTGCNGAAKAPKRCLACERVRFAERNARVFSWWEQGVRTSVIASREGMTETAVLTLVEYSRRLKGVPLIPRKRSHRELWPLIERRWGEGATSGEIAAECGTTRDNIAEMIRVMRKAGFDLPYRRWDKIAA